VPYAELLQQVEGEALAYSQKCLVNRVLGSSHVEAAPVGECARRCGRVHCQQLNHRTLRSRDRHRDRQPFNTSEEHASFKGTVSLSPATLILMLEEIVEGLRAQGLRKQVLTVGHGGSLWLGAFVKHINRRLEDIVLVDAHRGAGPVWEEALRQSGLAHRREVHGGALSRALALYLAPGSVTEGAYGERIPKQLQGYADYVGWERITQDGSWGRYDPATDEGLATAEAGRTLLEYFVKEQGQRLEEHLREACRIKGI
jgi:creatinine amidohydrolase